MQPYVIVLSASSTEASAYARRASLPRGRWRWPARAASIRGLRVAELHELPSYAKRRDRHAIEGELRHAKTTRVLVEMPEPPAVDQGDGMGEQLEITSLLEDLAADTPPAPAPAPIVDVGRIHVEGADIPDAHEVEDEEVGPSGEELDDGNPRPEGRQRRRRCRECGVLTFDANCCPPEPEAAPVVRAPIAMFD